MALIYPAAEVPMVQMSLKIGLSPREHIASGRALASLRDEDVADHRQWLELSQPSGFRTRSPGSVRRIRPGRPVVLESFGLAGYGYYARDEYIELDSIVPRLYLMTRIMQELGHK